MDNVIPIRAPAPPPLPPNIASPVMFKQMKNPQGEIENFVLTERLRLLQGAHGLELQQFHLKVAPDGSFCGEWWFPVEVIRPTVII